MVEQIPTEIIRVLILEFRSEYGPTFPLYGSETKRHDISGSIRPLLSSTVMHHDKVLAERSGIPKKTIQKIVNGDILSIPFEMADRLLGAMDKEYEWQDRLLEFY